VPKQDNSPNESINFREELKEREAEIDMLQQTFRLVASELDINKIFDSIAKRALHLVQAETLLIPILDNDKTTYTYRSGAGKNTREVIGETLPVEFGVCGWVWKHKKAWWRGVLDELSDEERTLWEKEAGTLILVPLQGRKEFLGGIVAINKKDGLEFTRRDLNTLIMFAGIVSIAIENALAIKELEDIQSNLIDHQLKLERLNRKYSESSHKVEQLSLYDPLTGLPNRSLLRDRLNTQLSISKEQKLILSILLIDINHFKSINDALGHDNGDQILIEFCRRIEKDLSTNETLSRLGSDEFILILPNTGQTKTVKRAKKILEDLEETYIINNNEFSIKASIGISLYPKHGKDRSTLLRHADIALNIAKKNNTAMHIFEEQEDETDEYQLSLAIDINNAFKNHEFELYYQPKIDIRTNTLISAEALGRWHHPKRGFISPIIFIEALEQYNLIDQYTYEAIETVAKNINRWTRAGHNLKIAVNISTKTLMHKNFVNEVQARIKDFSIYRRLVFEITESLFLSDYDHVFDSLTRIRALGIDLSIDDFGTGYSSLSRLKKLPVNELKIDQSFIHDMSDNIDDEIIVRSIIDLAHNLGLSVVAEGVETREILNKLNSLGCDIAQGYLISRPIPEKEFEILLGKYKA